MISDEEFSNLLNDYNYDFKVGQTKKGKIVNYDSSGVIVDIGAKNNAFCPEYEIILDGKDIKETLKQNKEYDFVIISEEDEDGIFQVSNKRIQFLENIKILKNKLKEDEILKGKVLYFVKGGLIASVLGVKGFMPTSQLAVDIKEGDDIDLKILSYDENSNSFIFSNKKVYQESIDAIKKEVIDKIEENMVVKGVVTRITNFGAFIDIGGLEGLLPLSQISWRWIDHPSRVLKVGDKTDVEIINIDKEKQRVSLSLKTLTENPWEKTRDNLKEGSVIKGKVITKKPFGIFVEVSENIEGLLTKNCVDRYIKKYNRVINEGDEIEVLVQKIDFDNQKIHLEFQEKL